MKEPETHSKKKRLMGEIPGFLLANGMLLKRDNVRHLRNLGASIRLLILVVLVAVIMGVAGWALLAALTEATRIRESNPQLFFLLPLVGIVTTWVYRRVGRRSERGNNLVIESAVTSRLIRARMAVLTFVFSVATHLTGGSAGREGAAVQIGGTIASNVSELFHLDEYDHHDLMLSGVSSAFGAVFGTPLAGAFFGMEMCFVGKLDYSAALYCLVGSFMGTAVSHLMGTRHMHEVISFVPDLDVRAIAIVIATAALFGLTARLFTALIGVVKRFFMARFTHPIIAAAVGSLILMTAFVLTGSQRYGGFSEWMVGAGFAGDTTPVDTLAKIVFTAMTVGVGFQGGEVTPLFGIGASLGGWLGHELSFEPTLLAALGMLSVFGAGLNVPLTAIVLGVDMFGGEAAPYFVIASFVSYFAAGHSSLYPAQRIVSPKRRSLAADAEHSVEDAQELSRRRAREEFEAELPRSDSAGPRPASTPEEGSGVEPER